MDPTTIAAIIAAVAPAVTQFVRWLIADKIPRVFLPLIAGAAGTGLALLSDATLATDLGPVVGGVVGLASTGLRDVIHIARTDGLATADTRKA